jgi:superfamily II DNA or RNA helicase
MTEGWERALEELDAALAQSPAQQAGFLVRWRLHVEPDYGVEVAAWVHKLDKKGKPGAGKALPRRGLIGVHGPKLSPEDMRVASLLSEREAYASRALLEALVDLPNVTLAEAPERAVRVERATVGLVAEDRLGTVRVTAGVDGAALPDHLIDRLRRGGETPVFLWDGQRLTLLDIQAEVRSALDVLRREGGLFPPESHQSLIGLLAKWAQRFPVAMPRSIMGRAAPSQTKPVVRFEVEPGGSVMVELRIRALPGAPAHVPGRGPRDIHVREGEEALHAVRDLKGEEDAARAFAAELPLTSAEPQEAPFQWAFPDAQGALGLLEAINRMDAPPDLEWVGRPLRSLGVVGPRALRVTVERRRDWFGMLGSLSVEGERVELARLLDATRRHQRFVEVLPGDFIELSETLRERLRALLDHTHATHRGVEAGPSAMASVLALLEAGASLSADDGWRALAHRLRSSPAPVEPPPGLEAALRPYQLAGFRWLNHLAETGTGGVLADDMGLGKTVQALALLLQRKKLGPALVVAPKSVAFNWLDEAQRFAPSLRVVRLSQVEDRAEAIRALGPSDVLVVGYGLLGREHARLSSACFATIVFDEAHWLKNATANRTRAARTIAAPLKIALTGTPMENHLGELWSVFAVVFPALFGSWGAFRRRYAAPIEKVADPEARRALGNVIRPFLLRRTKAEVEPDLPPRTDVRVPVVLSNAEWQLYGDARLAALSDLHTRRDKLREQERRVEVLAALTRLRLLASHPRLYDPRSDVASSKLARLLALTDELAAEGQRALVFSQFTSHLQIVRRALEERGRSCLYLDGQTPEKKRAALVRDFQGGEGSFFLISLQAAGFGINLTAASNVIHLDPWWNPAVEDQASDRAHRPGQTRAVTVYRLVSVGTIEEQMLALHAEKRSLAEGVAAGKDGSPALSADDLLALVARGHIP